MKPRVGVYLSEQMAARLAAAAKRPGATKSALVEAALDLFLGSDDDVGDTATVARRLGGLSYQIEQLDRNLRIANETAALHTRFHLAVTPILPAAAQGAACALGAERFEEFAAQVARRVDLGIPLIRETINKVSAVKADAFARDLAELESLGSRSAVYESGLPASTAVADASAPVAAVRGGRQQRWLSRPYRQRFSLMLLPAEKLRKARRRSFHDDPREPRQRKRA